MADLRRQLAYFSSYEWKIVTVTKYFMDDRKPVIYEATSEVYICVKFNNRTNANKAELNGLRFWYFHKS